MVRTRPLKWHGGKGYLASWIISLMPTHTHYVEPYFGGGAVLFQKDPHGVSEIVNDQYGVLTTFWRVLQDKRLFKEFVRLCQATPFSQVTWRKASAELRQATWESDATTRVSHAHAFFVLYRQSRQGLGKCFATLSRNRTRRGMNEQASSWLSAVESLPESHQRLRRVVILCDDAVEIIKREDGNHTLFYCDPPYLHETRHGAGSNCDYQCEMTAKQHEHLLKTLASISGKFLLSGYHSKLYDHYAQQNKWTCHERRIDNKSSGSKQKVKKIECVWSNIPLCCEKHSKHVISC